MNSPVACIIIYSKFWKIYTNLVSFLHVQVISKFTNEFADEFTNNLLWQTNKHTNKWTDIANCTVPTRDCKSFYVYDNFLSAKSVRNFFLKNHLFVHAVDFHLWSEPQSV